MKRVVIILMMLFAFYLLLCCESPRQKYERTVSEHNVTEGVRDDVLYIKEIDGCEYVILHGLSGRGGIIHKANCKNTYHVK